MASQSTKVMTQKAFQSAFYGGEESQTVLIWGIIAAGIWVVSYLNWVQKERGVTFEKLSTKTKLRENGLPRKS